MIDDRDVSLDRSINMWKNLPIDTREVIESLAQIDNIHYPFVGMIFYSKFEDDYYKVLSLEDGFKNNRNGKVYREKDTFSTKGLIKLENYLVGSYEQYTLKGNQKTMITKAEIRNGYLYITFHDGKETNVGYVVGEPGYSPQIIEDINNNSNLSLKELIYKLNIKFFNEETHKINEFTTDNLIGPYVVSIIDKADEEGNKTGYLEFILSNGYKYEVGPYGIKDIEIKENSDKKTQNLIIYFNDGTSKDLGNIRGKDGTSVRILGTLENESNLPNREGTVQNGDGYIVGKNLWFYYEHWYNVGKIVGDDGKTPNISCKYSISKANKSDEDQRSILTIEFFDEDKLIESPIKFRLPYSPSINVISNNKDTYRVQFVAYTNEGERVEIVSPNLKGKDGNSINIKDNISSLDELLALSPKAELGDSYLFDNPEDPNDGHLWTFTGEIQLDDAKHKYGFLDVGKIKGPQGAQGNDGSDGERGQDGYSIKLIQNTVTGYLQYCYIDKDKNEVSEYENLIKLSTITGAAGFSPSIEIIENNENNTTKLNIINENGSSLTANLRGKNGKDGKTGSNGYSLELRYLDNLIEYRYYLEDINGNKTYPKGEEWTYLCKIPKISSKTIINGVEITVGDDKYIIQNGKEVIIRYNESNDFIEWKYNTETTWTKIISKEELKGANGENGTNGKDIEIGNITTTTLETANAKAKVTVSLNQETSNETTNIYDFKFEIPKGVKGDNGVQGTSITNIEGINNSNGILTQIKIVTENPKDNSTNEYIFPTGLAQPADGNEGRGIDDVKVKYNTSEDILTFTIIYTDTTNKQVNVTGIKGPQGEPGQDGQSINVTLEEVTNGTKVIFSDENNTSFIISNGIDGREIELKKFENTIKWKYIGTEVWKDLITLEEIKGNDGESITATITKEDKTTTVTFSDGQSFTVKDGENGKDGISPDPLTITSTEKVNGTNTVTFSDGTIITIEDGVQGINGNDGFSPEINLIEVENGVKIDVTKKDGTIVSKTVLNGTNGENGLNGTDGTDGIGIKTVTINDNYELIVNLTDNTEINLGNIRGEKGENGLNGEDGYSPTVIENENNTVDIYKLDITYKDSEGNIQTYTTPNLKGDNGTASKFIICETLPAIAEGELNTIYFLLTPIYQRGLNIGLTDDTKANKNFYEEWVIIEKEDGSRSWEILSPQVYRISEKMIDYVWKVRNDYTVYDDWFDTTDISDYQKEYGDITPLSNFVYRIEGSEIILVKYIGSGDVYLNIAPRYKIGDKVYTVTELDGTYYPEKTYYQIDGDGNVTNYIFNTDLFQYDDNGIETTQTLLTGPQVYSLYIADTVTKLTRVLINTSNIPKYHIPSGIETIGDYAFYSSANQTMVFEKLSADGKTAVQVGFESSNVKYIGEYGCACTTNMRMINDEGIDTNYLITPAGLKKISNHAFYRAGQIAHVDTRKSSNLYVGKEAFTRANLSAVQYLSPTTYYTDNSFLGYTELYHNSRVVNGGGLYFYNSETIGYNYNDIEHTEASETAKLNVTLTTVDPVFE